MLVLGNILDLLYEIKLHEVPESWEVLLLGMIEQLIKIIVLRMIDMISKLVFFIFGFLFLLYHIDGKRDKKVPLYCPGMI